MKHALTLIVLLCFVASTPAFGQLKDGEIYSLGISITESDRGHPVIDSIHTGGGAWDNGGFKKGDEIVLVGLSELITGRGVMGKAIQDEARESQGAISIIIRRNGKLMGRAVWTKAVDLKNDPRDYRDIRPKYDAIEFIALYHAASRAMGNPLMRPQGDPNKAENLRNAASLLYALTEACEDVDISKIPDGLAKKYKAMYGFFRNLADYYNSAPRLDQRHQERMDALGKEHSSTLTSFHKALDEYMEEENKKANGN